MAGSLTKGVFGRRKCRREKLLQRDHLCSLRGPVKTWVERGEYGWSARHLEVTRPSVWGIVRRPQSRGDEVPGAEET